MKAILHVREGFDAVYALDGDRLDIQVRAMRDQSVKQGCTKKLSFDHDEILESIKIQQPVEDGTLMILVNSIQGWDGNSTTYAPIYQYVSEDGIKDIIVCNHSNNDYFIIPQGEVVAHVCLWCVGGAIDLEIKKV